VRPEAHTVQRTAGRAAGGAGSTSGTGGTGRTSGTAGATGPGGTIDEAGDRLRAWVQTVAGAVSPDVSVSLDPPAAAPAGRGVGLYLLELDAAPVGQGARRPALRLAVRYLVTAWAETPALAHRLLAAIAFAALEAPESELVAELRPLAPEAWAAFGVLPRPSLFLRVPVQKERPPVETPVVRKPLVVQLQVRNNGTGG
jgi:hypothetical protein